MEELEAKQIIYKVIAPATYDRGGITRMCSSCGKDYTDHIDSDADIIICCLCAMGRADGVFVPKAKETRRMRVKIDTERRLQDEKRNGSS